MLLYQNFLGNAVDSRDMAGQQPLELNERFEISYSFTGLIYFSGFILIYPHEGPYMVT